MKVEVENLEAVRKKIEVMLPLEQVAVLEESILEELRREVKLKGFRQGKVPKQIIVNFYKDYIEDEVKRRMVQTTMGQALAEAKVNPLGEPVIDFFEKEGNTGYSLDCEVVPEFDLPEYMGLPVDAETIEVTEDEIDKRIDGLREMHAQMLPKEGNSLAEAGDFVFIKYQGYLDGKPLKEVATESYPLELGKNTLMPEFENAVVGMKAAEEKKIEIDFTEDYPDKEIAGKRILFEVTLKDIRQKKLPEVNDDFAKDLGFDEVGILRDGLRAELVKEKEKARRRRMADSLMEQLLGATEIPVPKRFLEKRVTARMEEIRERMRRDNFAGAEELALEENFRQEFGKREEEKIRAEMILVKIADKEGVKVDDGDVEARIRKIAEDAKRPYEEARQFYEQNEFMDSLRGNILQEKIVDLLVANASVKEQ